MLGLSPVSDRLRHVLVLGAHPDDIEIGCGGTLLTLAERHPDLTVTWVVATLSGDRRMEAHRAAELFMPGHKVEFIEGGLPDGRLPGCWAGVKELLEGVAQGRSFDAILAPSRTDSHQDHRTIGEIVPTVWRDQLVLSYEIPKWDGDLSRLNAFVPLTEDIVRRKVALLHEAFPSQHGRQWWDPEVFLGLARLRGVECQSRYAEAFSVDKVTLAW